MIQKIFDNWCRYNGHENPYRELNAKNAIDESNKKITLAGGIICSLFIILCLGFLTWSWLK